MVRNGEQRPIRVKRKALDLTHVVLCSHDGTSLHVPDGDPAGGFRRVSSATSSDLAAVAREYDGLDCARADTAGRPGPEARFQIVTTDFRFFLSMGAGRRRLVGLKATAVTSNPELQGSQPPAARGPRPRPQRRSGLAPGAAASRRPSPSKAKSPQQRPSRSRESFDELSIPPAEKLREAR